MTETSSAVNSLMAAIADVGTDPRRGGYSRPVWSPAEKDLRAWFLQEAHAGVWTPRRIATASSGHGGTCPPRRVQNPWRARGGAPW